MRRALRAIEKLQANLAKSGSHSDEPIAVIGLGCRFPGGATSPDAFWRMLRDGRDAISPVPSDRWDVDHYYDPNPETPGKIVSRDGGFLDSIRQFDADFFGIAPKEAKSLDPQQRLLLEVSWEAMEDAGIIPSAWSGRPVGVFVGISTSDYSRHLMRQADKDIDAYLATGNSHSVAAGRLSYCLGLTGPSLITDTACSSSLVAVHLAIQSLRSGESEAALVGGVNCILSPDTSITFSRARMLSPRGRCRTFSGEADGFVRAEGCGVVALRRLSDAQANGDRVLAVIKSSAINQDGRSSGLTVPNGPSQQTVIRNALRIADIDPTRVGYIETHGTGTQLGDPIELNALGQVFAGSHHADDPLLIGSLKTNLGHMEAAAGIGGLIKTVLAIKHQKIPPHLHFDRPTPRVDWPSLPLRVTDRMVVWPNDRPLAGVSSFGFSGTNAHVILDAAPQASVFEPADPVARLQTQHSIRPLFLSAKDESAIDALADLYAERLEQGASWADLCWSAFRYRSRFKQRIVVIADSATDAIEKLRGRKQWSSEDGEADCCSAEITRAAKTWLGGEDPEWPCEAGKRVDLPTYPFQRRVHWIGDDSIDPSATDANASDPDASDPMSVDCRLPDDPIWQEHRVFGTPVLPAVGFFEWMIAAIKLVRGKGSQPFVLTDVSFVAPLPIGEIAETQVTITQNEKLERIVVSRAGADEALITHAVG
ncbi:MAG: beta-ketoacyl synthase N-terminal-like domain-containing protein, partial [Planctomycetota bacterium]